MGNTATALIFVMFINVIMWTSQIAMINIAPVDSNYFYNCTNTILDVGGNSCQAIPNTQTLSNDLPTAQTSTQPSSGNFFTDIFTSIVNWFSDTLHLNYILSIVSAPVNILNAMGLPADFSLAIGLFWYGITFFLIVSFFWWRD